MPPARSGIADYSAALLESMSRIADVTVFDRAPEHFDPASFDIPLYQVGNNSWHAFVYEQALRSPGVVVMHEANLHHLIAEITIKRNDWDGYLREVEFDGGPRALEYARRVRALEVGPDYEGVPMLRRLLQSSRGAIAHSRAVQKDLLSAGFTGPTAVIPHGAWIPDTDRMGFRHRLGVSVQTPLVGIFGFLKPYKRIAESLRAFRRLLRLHPEAKMILVGEPHPDFALQSLISTLGIERSVRVLGFTPIDDFVGYIAACDIILNLRWPTVGESSGTLLRSLGLGRAVLVSDVGSFSEYPDEICFKVPVGVGEEDTIFEYLNLLVTRPEVAHKLGKAARRWVEQECSWDSVADRYVEFLERVVSGRVPKPAETATAAAVGGAADRADHPEDSKPAPIVEPEYILGWAADAGGRSYALTHIDRLQKTLQITPPGAPDKRVLEMGAYMQITPALRSKLQYGEVRGCYYGKLGEIDHKEIVSADGEHFTCDVDHFDAERDAFPYPDEHFDTVLCCELLEHLPTDPMHMMSEINRILKPGGHLVITTPNICSVRAIAAILQGYHPGFFPAYIRPSADGTDNGARHAREYAPRELAALFRDGGFEVASLETGEFREEAHPEHEWVRQLLDTYWLDPDLRGDGLYAVGVKRGPVHQRYPSWLYN